MMTTFFDRRLPACLVAGLVACWLSGCQTTSATGQGEGASSGGMDQVSQAAQRRFADAIQSFEEGKQLQVMDWDALERKFQAVISEDDRFAEAHYNLGIIAERRGYPEEAVGHYRAAIERKPGLDKARENLGLVLERLGDERSAESEYKELLRLLPDHAGGRARLAALHLKSGNTHRAQELAREALLRDPKNLAALRVLVGVHVSRNEHEVARLVAIRIGTLDESNPEGPYLLGTVLESQGKRAASILHYRKAAELSAGHIPSRAKLARFALETRSYTEAEALYETLIRLEPRSFEARLNLGMARYGKGDIEEAMEALQAAQALRPEDVRPSYPIALILHRHANEPEKALEAYRRFVSGAPFHLRPEHQVFKDLRECEQLVQFLAAARAEEEAVRRREEAKAKAEAEAAAREAAGPLEAGPGEGEPENETSSPVPASAPTRPSAAPAETDPDLVLPEGFDPDEPDDDF